MANEKISAMPTLANPPLAPVFLSGITNDGTTTANVQIPQGVIVQPALGTGTTRGAGIVMLAASSTGKYGANVVLRGGDVTNPGTAYSLQGGGLNERGGNTTITNAAGTGSGGAFQLQGGGAYQGANHALGGGVNLFGGKIANGTRTGGSSTLYAQGGDKSGNVNIQCYGALDNGTNGNIILDTNKYGFGTNVTAGHIIVNSLGTVDPHVLNAAWLGVSNGVTLSAG